MYTPAARQAIMVRPEQSKESGPLAAYSYGLPSCARAYSIAVAARPLGGGGSGAEVAPPRDLPLLYRALADADAAASRRACSCATSVASSPWVCVSSCC